eukprot:4783816-Pyramimonas_sp.AAC.1
MADIQGVPSGSPSQSRRPRTNRPGFTYLIEVPGLPKACERDYLTMMPMCIRIRSKRDGPPAAASSCAGLPSSWGDSEALETPEKDVKKNEAQNDLCQERRNLLKQLSEHGLGSDSLDEVMFAAAGGAAGGAEGEEA